LSHLVHVNTLLAVSRFPVDPLTGHVAIKRAVTAGTSILRVHLGAHRRIAADMLPADHHVLMGAAAAAVVVAAAFCSLYIFISMSL